MEVNSFIQALIVSNHCLKIRKFYKNILYQGSNFHNLIKYNFVIKESQQSRRKGYDKFIFLNYLISVLFGD